MHPTSRPPAPPDPAPRPAARAARLLVLLALVPAGGLPAARAAGPSDAPSPNIVFLFSDDHALRAIGAYGSGLCTTPQIDRLADEGAIFTRSFCTTSICCPSRAAILTGKHGHKNGVVGNADVFDSRQFVFPRALGAAGYQTALVGKWHLRGDPGDAFDHWEILSGAGGQGHYYAPDFRAQDGTERRLPGYSADVITDLALRWLNESRDPERPFLLMCQFKAPHIHRVPPPRHMDRYDGVRLPVPPTLFDDYRNRVAYAADTNMEIRDMPEFLFNIVPPEGEPIDTRNAALEFLDRMTSDERRAYHRAYDPDNAEYRRRKAAGELTGLTLEHYQYQRFMKDYLGCVAAIDDNVGRILQWLDDHGLAENTVVIYSSDQGFFTGEHGWAEKRWMYEESLSMPLLMRWPARIRPGTRIDALIQNIDYAPTFLELAGAPRPDDLQGRSLLPLLDGRPPDDWRRAIYYHYDDGNAYNLPKIEGVRDERYKLIHYYAPREAWELFDLRRDPLELRNAYDDPHYADAVADMKNLLREMRRTYGVPADTGVPPAPAEAPTP